MPVSPAMLQAGLASGRTLRWLSMHWPAATTSQLAVSAPVPQPTRPGVVWPGWAGVSVAGSGSGLVMALLSERAQPPEELVNDGAELAPYDQPVEHGGGRVGRRVVRLDPHRGLVACRRGETGDEPVAGEHLAEPEGVVNDQERRARLWHRLDAPLDHGSLLAVHGHRAGARRAQAGVVAATFVVDGVDGRRPVGQLCVVHEQPVDDADGGVDRGVSFQLLPALRVHRDLRELFLAPYRREPMRIMDRHDQLLRLLRRRADWTVAALARELGVSRRTV